VVLALCACQRGPSTSEAYALEAKVQLLNLVKGVKIYLAEEHLEPGALVVAGTTGSRLPGSAPLTPASCCEPCEPDPKQWQAPSWLALRFELTDKHYFRYQFTADESTFTARAQRGCPEPSDVWEVFGQLGELGALVVTQPARPAR
jgi:hypothetical protein